jgi:hypothetical protein
MVDEHQTGSNSSKTIGEINLDLEKTKFKKDYQPYIVMIDESGHVMKGLDAVPDDKIVLQFLRSR